MYSSYQLSIITNDGIVTTPHYGADDETADTIAELWNKLQTVENTNDLRSRFAAFTQGCDPETPEAGKVNLLTQAPPETNGIVFDRNGAWYADFVIIRNLTDRDFDITAMRGTDKETCLYNGESVVLNLGGFHAGSDTDIARRKMLAELDGLKENLWDDNAGKNYSMLWNLCADYDNDRQDRLYLTDVISEAEFVDEYLLEDYFQNVLAKEPSLARIRHFIGDTYDDELYRFDGYGNLANVNKDDFIEVIDNVQEKIIDAIVPEKPIRPQSGSDSDNARAHTGDACM